MLHTDHIENSSSPSLLLSEGLLSSRGVSLKKIREAQKSFFAKGKTRSFEFRDRQLRCLLEAIVENEDRILEALTKDLKKPSLEAFAAEVGFVYNEIKHVRAHLEKWMRPRRARGSLLVFPGQSKLISEPLGQVLIIGPWNYPFQLVISPLIGAIAAGNCAILKPSELTVHTSRVIAEIINETFPEDYIAVFEGGADVSLALLDEPFDHIFFTGSSKVGKVVAQAAAKHLSGVTLELGGKSPCIVHKDAPLKMAARKVTWGKFLNCGQTCVAPDYLLVHKDIKEEFLKLLTKQIKKFFGSDPQKSPDYARIVSKNHCERLAGFLDEGRVITGGLADVEECYLAPTILDDINFSNKIMEEEIFGPILPVITYDDLDKALVRVAERPKALSLYFFSKDKKLIDKVQKQVSFGGGCINDTIMHLANPHLPFGGVGHSGHGSYHGKESFKTFSHQKSLLVQNSWFDLPARYPPYRDWKTKIFKLLMKP